MSGVGFTKDVRFPAARRCCTHANFFYRSQLLCSTATDECVSCFSKVKILKIYILLGKKNAKHWGNLKRKAYGTHENLLQTTNLQENSSNIFRIAEQSIFLRSKVA